MPNTLNAEIINAAIEGFEAQKRRIDEQIDELRATLSGSGAEGSATAPVAKRPRRTMSASARRKIAEAQRKRWAAVKGKSEAPAPAEETKQSKRKLSSAGRKRIIEANRKRWAAQKTGPRKERAISRKAGAKRKAVKRSPSKSSEKSTTPATE